MLSVKQGAEMASGTQRTLEAAYKTLEAIDRVPEIPEIEPGQHVKELLTLNAHLNYHLISAVAQELLRLRALIEPESDDAQGT
jgi:hypothetical protein